jgi:hypothetical protein
MLARGLPRRTVTSAFPFSTRSAGCGNADVLAHCRSDGELVRGCWLVDLLLGKG